ncbi:NADH dehydrogenase [ubiquinone] 1 alpha subcomplex subunit 1-like [Homalodisca vitripennis]|uniref:NADH dehydrogenase [ubiquinone] 1 alpha subcomplex subunit 1-like n=1 Tax=Homalodisca vitripennis TaxID=197043 RepID=UPI001EEC2D8D|nr:NADH dehydrogenase [ubiquinone] 1 alpha subcomplex subunit 1-like [Homalodisca vitripennis]
MWYEILPTMAIMTACLSIPPVAAHFVHKFFQNGNPCRRDLTTEINRRQFLRDNRLTGNTYVLAGLEAIPDE